jgi:hypothetical protein
MREFSARRKSQPFLGARGGHGEGQSELVCIFEVNGPSEF